MDVRQGICRGGTRASYRHVTMQNRMRNEDARRSLGQEAGVDIVKKQTRWKVRMKK